MMTADDEGRGTGKSILTLRYLSSEIWQEGLNSGLRERIRELLLDGSHRLFVSGLPSTALTHKPVQNNIFDATKRLIALISAVREAGPQLAAQTDLAQLRRILPGQKIAPMRFEFEESKLVLARRRTRHDPRDRDNIRTARSELLVRGKEIIGELTASNCDRRLLESVRYLLTQIEDDGNIIRVGMSNMTVEAMVRQFQEELPEAVIGMLNSHTANVSMYIAQFADWNRFAENAALAEIEPEAFDSIRRATDTLIDQLQSKPDIVDREIPLTFRHLQALIREPGRAAKRAVFAILRSIENMVSKVFSLIGELVDKTAHQVIDGLSKTVSRVVIIALLTVALESAGAISPIASRITEMSWLKNALEIVERHIEGLRTTAP
jgi:hypothetical protein